jgi:hypothetical protein
MTDNESEVPVLTRKEIDLEEQLKSRTKKELADIASGIFRGEIFTDRHIRESDFSLITNIFMPLIFMDESQGFYLAKAGMLYSYMKEASPTGINGYPCFFSLSLLNDEDAKIVWQMYDDIVVAIANVLEGDTYGSD